jgi:hypothetical protein
VSIEKKEGRHPTLKSFLNGKCVYTHAQPPCDSCMVDGLLCGPKISHRDYMSIKDSPRDGKGFISEQPVEKPVFLDNDSGPNATIPSSPPIHRLPGNSPLLGLPQPADSTFDSSIGEFEYGKQFDFFPTTEWGNGLIPFDFYESMQLDKHTGIDVPEDCDQRHWQTSEAQGNTIATLSVTPLCISTSPLFTKIKNQSFTAFLPDGFNELANLFENLEIAMGLDYLPDDIPFANPSDFKMEWFSGDISQRPV